jgi:isoleucyl-tRNA synthetase
VRLSRRRFWKGEYELDKISAYQTLYTVLLNVSKLSAPIAPFFMDKLYQDLTKNVLINNVESVHLDLFPKVNLSLIDKKLEEKIKYAQRISSLTLSLRAKEKIKVRQPLNKIMIPVNSNEQKKQISSVSELIKREVNVKKIEFIEGHSDLLIKKVKPKFKNLGPRFGAQMKEITSIVENLTLEQIQNLEINKKNVTFDVADFEIFSNDIEGWLVVHEGNITVALDITIDEDLIDEGISRELISRIQNIRKASGFEVTDRIKIVMLYDDRIARAVDKNIDYMKSETLANSIELKKDLDNGTEVDFDKIKIKIFITKE